MMRVVIFDMDGTLVDTKRDITISINYVREKNYSLPPLSEEFIVEAINMHERNLPKLFYETDVYHKSDRDVFEEHYHTQCVQNPLLYDGIHETLRRLSASDVKLSVATNAPTQFAKRILSHLDIDGFFDVIIGADEVNASKPDPKMIEYILLHYAFEKDRDKAWMIGDNSKDIISAQKAGIDSLFATWGFSPKSTYEWSVHKPEEILDIVL